jgi:NTE family protein
LDSVSAAGGLGESATLHHVNLPKHLVVISVNAETDPPRKLDLSAAAPGVTALLNAVSGAQIRRYNFETLLFAREGVQNWVSDVNAAGADVTGYVLEVSFDNIKDPDRRRMLKALPTSFSLSDEQVDDLRSAARELLEQSPEYQRLLRTLGQP